MNTIYRIWRKSDEIWMYDVSTKEAAENHSKRTTTLCCRTIEATAGCCS